MKIPLFDLDGTLIKRGNKVHRQSFVFAVKKVFDIDIDFENMKTGISGMIDSQIFIEILFLYGVKRQESQAKLPDLFLQMGNYFLGHENEAQYEALEGSYELLENLFSKGIPIAVLTGNLETIGWKKLEKTDLKKFIALGAFGNMALKRADLIPIALEKLQLECDEQIQKSNLVIIGDTPLDIRCAKEGGIKSIGVATGKYSKDELKIEGADLVFESLLQKQELLDYLLE